MEGERCYPLAMWVRLKERLSLLADVLQVLGARDVLFGLLPSGAIGLSAGSFGVSSGIVLAAAILVGLIAFPLVTWLRTRRGWIPMHIGARLAYEALRDTIDGGMARRTCDGDPEKILDYFAVAISNEQGVRIRGIRPPSTIQEEVPFQMFRRGSILGGGRQLSFYGEPTAAYENLSVRAEDVRAAIKRRRQIDRDLSGEGR